MSDWDAVDWSFAEHMRRARSVFGDAWPANNNGFTRELGADGNGAVNMLARAGLDQDLRKNDVFWYFGDDGGKPTSREYALFEYVDGYSFDGVIDDLHAPDDPDALAPPQGVELCALLVKEVVSFVGAGGGTRTWVLGQSFSMARYLRRAYSQRCARISDVIDFLHPREHVLTDLWQAVRIHNVVAVGTRRTLCDSDPVIPPPTGILDDFPLFWRPGCVQGLDTVRNSVSKQALRFKADPAVRPCTCCMPGCERPGYDRGEDTVARCTTCEKWFHERCVQMADDDQEFTALDVKFTNGLISGPITRRAPNQGTPVFKDGQRGLAVRVDPPVRTWERLAAGVIDARYWVDLEEDDDGVEFRAVWRLAVKGGDEAGDLPAISDSAADEALQEIEALGGEGVVGAPLLVCPFCDALM